MSTSINFKNSVETANKLQNFLALKKGWNFGEGEVFEIEIINLATALHEEFLLRNFIETDAFPGSNGEVMLTIYHEEHYLEFILELDRTITLLYEVNDQEVFSKEKLSISTTITWLDKFMEILWMQSEFLVTNNTIKEKSDSPALLLETQVNNQAYPSLTRSVSWKPTMGYANTYASTINQFPTSHLSSGSFRQSYCQKTIS